MSAQSHDLDDDAIAQTTRNIDLVGVFLQEILAQPTILETIPSGATIVLIPDDNPTLAQANRTLADQAAAEGKDVHVRHVHEAARHPGEDGTGPFR